MAKRVVTTAFAYLAAVIGAGFASGSEAAVYFLRYGKISYIGIILSSVLSGLFVYVVLYLCRKNEAYDFDGFADSIMPPLVSRAVKMLLSIFMLIVTAAMIGAYSDMASFFSGTSALHAVVFCVLCAVILFLPQKQVINTCGILGIVIVAAICVFCLYMINNRFVNVFSNYGSMTASSLTYTGYNTITVCPMLCSMAADLKSNRECAAAGAVSFVMTLAVLSLVWCLTGIYYGKVPLGNMPMLTISARQGDIFCLGYAAVLFLSMLTSAVANCYGIYLRFKSRDVSKFIKILMILSGAYLISSFGFLNIVSKLYKAAGYASLTLILFILIKIIKNKDKRSKITKYGDNTI